ncbi:MAG: IS3 family transposase, partial [Dehalococcoidia bacterium]|nr:IS3 family transposase [Dehalococcoidia bacterium]
MQTPENQRRRAFTPQYKADAVALCRTGGKSIGEIARDLGLVESVLRRWVKQTEVDAGQREG